MAGSCETTDKRTPPGPEGSNGSYDPRVPQGAWPLFLFFVESANYQVIARRWRPRQFSELVGQDHIVRTLGNAIQQGRIAHAFLFIGPRGTGKTSTARLLAKALNCTGGPAIHIPEDCPISESIGDGSCLDVIEIDGASNNSVDQIRDLRDNVRYAPTQCRFKIYIIDEVHMLTSAAFNALLKTLEEPPPHVKFIFATTEAQKVLPTIVSRCQRFEFRPIANQVIVDKLDTICKAEGIDVEKEALEGIAQLAMGGMRDAQSILDQLISFCGKKVQRDDVLQVYGLVSRREVEDIATEMMHRRYSELLARIDGLVNEGKDLYRLLLDLQAVFRERLLAQIQGEAESGLSIEGLSRLLDVLHKGEYRVKTGLSERANFEILILKAIEESRSRPIEALLQELQGVSAEKKKP